MKLQNNYIKSYKLFLESSNWKELPKGDDLIKGVILEKQNCVLKLTSSVDAANVANFLLDKKSDYIASILDVKKIKGKKQYFIIEELVKPFTENDIKSSIKEILSLIEKQKVKIPDAFKKSELGLLDLLYYLYEEKIALDHELVYSYSLVFEYLNKVLKIKEFDLNSFNMAKRKDKYILFDLNADIKKQKIDEIVISPELKSLDDVFEWYVNTQIK